MPTFEATVRVLVNGTPLPNFPQTVRIESADAATGPVRDTYGPGRKTTGTDRVPVLGGSGPDPFPLQSLVAFVFSPFASGLGLLWNSALDAGVIPLRAGGMMALLKTTAVTEVSLLLPGDDAVSAAIMAAGAPTIPA